MKQSEKLDVILKQLYEKKFDGKFHNINKLLADQGYSFGFSEIFALAKRLDDEGLIKMHGTKSAVVGKIESYGVDYCETESHSNPASSVINNTYNYNVSNSNSVNIVTQSQNVKIENKINEISNLLESILKKIETDQTIDSETKRIIEELSEEIKISLRANHLPKRGIESLISIIGSISSVSSLATSLAGMLI